MSHANAMKAKIAMGRKQLGLDDETYRAMLENITGKRSASQCNIVQLARVIDHMASKGAVFTSAKPKGEYKAKAAQRRSDFYEIPDSPNARQKRHICAMWRELGYDMTSLDARVKRQFGVDAFRWMNDPAQLQILGKDLAKRLAGKKKKSAAKETA